jgi:hypothetical protein
MDHDRLHGRLPALRDPACCAELALLGPDEIR